MNHAAAPALDLRGIGKTFGTFTALKAIDLCIQRGEFLCLLGPSGCGKTTLLRIIAGLERQDVGALFMDGRDISRAEPAERDFGIVFQSYALFPNLTVRDNIGYGLINRRVDRAATTARIEEMLALVGLGDQATKYPGQLSGGQQQRVALARALATQPRLLLLDEPLSALDARVRAYLRGEIRALHDRLGITTIMVTHDREEALAMADRIVVMREGCIVQDGDPQSLYHAPANAFAADFLGAMNFLPVTVIDRQHVGMGSSQIRHEADNIAAIGSTVHLGIRPEDIRIVPADAKSANTLVARVNESVFLGAYFRITFTVMQGESTLFADLPGHIVKQHDIRPGHVFNLHLPQGDLRIFAMEQPA